MSFFLALILGVDLCSWDHEFKLNSWLLVVLVFPFSRYISGILVSRDGKIESNSIEYLAFTNSVLEFDYRLEYFN